MEKPEIPDGKLNNSHHSVWKASEIWTVVSGDAIFLLFLVCSADLDSHLWRVVTHAPRQIFQFYVYTQDFHPGGLCKWQGFLVK